MTDLMKILKFIKELDSNTMQIKGKLLSKAEIAAGLRVSRLACSYPRTVSVTPWFKNMLSKYDNIDKDKGNALNNSDKKLTDSEKLFFNFQEQLLNKYCGKEEVKYNTQVSDMDKSHYNVDCWRNKVIRLRHFPLQQDFYQQLRNKVSDFTQPTKLDKGQKSVIDLIYKDRNFQQAVMFVLEMMPYFTSSSEITQLNAYYQTKHTNVGAPYFRNDRTKVSIKGQSLTYGELCLQKAKEVSTVDDLFPYIMLINRSNRGKVRPVLATSRIANLYFNQILKPAVETYKLKCPFMLTYNDTNRIKQILQATRKCIPNNYTFMNRDYSRYDTTITKHDKLMGFAMLMLRCRDFRGKRIIQQAAQYYCSPKILLDGIDGEIKTIYPRMYSGELFTNFLENIINAVHSVYVQLSLDENFIHVARSILDKGATPMLFMGDDNGIVQLRHIDDDKYSLLMKSLGKIIYPIEGDKPKGEYGWFILQHRLFDNGNVDSAFVTPFTRVLLSMMVRERPVGIGYYGWTMAAFQHFSRLEQFPQVRDDIIRFFAKFDKLEFGTKQTYSQFKKNLSLEDNNARALGKPASAERLYDGDPKTTEQFIATEAADNTPTVDWNRDYVKRMFRIVKSALK